MISDIISALIVYLQTTEVLNHVADRIYGGEIPDCEIGNMPQKLIVLRYAGGPISFRSSYLQNQRVDILSYGETYFESKKVDGALIQALHDLARIDTVNTFLQSVGYGGAWQSKDSKTGWEYMLRITEVIADERVTA